LFVLFALLKNIFKFIKIYNFISKQTLDERVVVLVTVDHVHLVLIDRGERVHNLLQSRVGTGDMCSLEECKLDVVQNYTLLVRSLKNIIEGDISLALYFL